MTSPTTIKRLRELLEKASPGEWCCSGSSGFPLHDKHGPLLQEFRHTPPQIFADATLIAEMKRHLPALLDRVEAMERALKPFEASTLVGQSALIVAGDAITQAFDSGKKYVTIVMEGDAAPAFNAARSALSGSGE